MITVSLLASALLGAGAPGSYPTTIDVSREGRAFFTCHQMLISGQTARDDSGGGDDLTTVWLTPVPQQDGKTMFHVVLERERIGGGVRSVLKASSNFAFDKDRGVLRLKLPPKAEEGATEVRIAIGDSGSDAKAASSTE